MKTIHNFIKVHLSLYVHNLGTPLVITGRLRFVCWWRLNSSFLQYKTVGSARYEFWVLLKNSRPLHVITRNICWILCHDANVRHLFIFIIGCTILLPNCVTKKSRWHT